MDVNVLRNLCKAIHVFGRSRFAAYKTVLLSEGVFSQEIRTVVWMDYVEMYKGSLRAGGWLWPYLKLYVAIQAEGYQLIRNIHYDVIGHVNRRYVISSQLCKAKEDDDVGMFEMLRTIEGVRLTKTFVCNVLRSCKACPNIIENLIKTSAEMASVFPPDEMMLYACSCGRNIENSFAAVRALVDCSPDCIHVCDPVGLTPVDYIFFNPRVDDERRIISKCSFVTSPDAPVPVCWNEILRLLVELGCDPDHKNKYGISSMDVMRMHQDSLFLEDWWHKCQFVPEQHQHIRNIRKLALGKTFKELCKGLGWD